MCACVCCACGSVWACTRGWACTRWIPANLRGGTPRRRAPAARHITVHTRQHPHTAARPMPAPSSVRTQLSHPIAVVGPIRAGLRGRRALSRLACVSVHAHNRQGHPSRARGGRSAAHSPPVPHPARTPQRALPAPDAPAGTAQATGLRSRARARHYSGTMKI